MRATPWIDIAPYIFKVLIPAVITVVVGSAIEYKKTRRFSMLEFSLSLIIGVGTAYLSSGYILDKYPEPGESTILIAVITMFSSKIWEFLYVYIGAYLSKLEEKK